ncbi:MAG: DNA polymerase III subunit chi [Tabrizicola sp.]|uniref:DNA polymerase III subunit chi n=1 Tax=Tabrizicola sp. TaxID=2005166 RepID=UPI002ABB281E|nr:DNA polymerase III subunit chi [Tabrizicola sp.]MDZ4088713.1 DNA polymerase III subunit chi [Tabrizicola sp.]
MGTVMFFHLMQSAPADTLAVNAPRALGQGWRVMVRGTDPAALDLLDQALWLKGGDDSFLPHGLDGGPHDADQPVLLGLGQPVNGAKVLALIDGAEATDAEIAAMERVWVLFDGNDPARLQAARAQWKAMTTAGHAAQYWSEESGRWEKKAESAAR